MRFSIFTFHAYGLLHFKGFTTKSMIRTTRAAATMVSTTRSDSDSAAEKMRETAAETTAQETTEAAKAEPETTEKPSDVETIVTKVEETSAAAATDLEEQTTAEADADADGPWSWWKNNEKRKTFMNVIQSVFYCVKQNKTHCVRHKNIWKKKKSYKL